MFVFNLKINKKKFIKIFTITVLVLALLIFILSISKILNNNHSNNEKTVLLKLDSSNYTDFLKNCHENIDEFVGTKISITGYVYRMKDFNENQFVIARTMLLPSNHKAVVVGILAECDSIKDFEDYSWVSCSGTIQKGYYNGDMPVVHIETINKSSPPEEEYVYSPLSNNDLNTPLSISGV